MGKITRTNRTVMALAVMATIGMVASGCSGDSEPAGEDLSEVEIPDYYPADYTDLIEASQEEGGELLLYSNVDQRNFATLLRDFQSRYPWVTTISAENMDSDVIFQRQLSDAATGGTNADLLVSNAIQAWARYAATDNAILDYDSPEMAELPEFAELSAGVYAVSMDPVGLTYNTALFPGEPTSHAEMAEIVAEDPEMFEGKIGARDIEGAYGFSASRAFVEGKPELQDAFETLVPMSRPESSSGTQNEKLLSGEYWAGIVVSSSPAYSISVDPATSELFKYVLPTDGVVVLGRGMGITPDAPHPATAKLFLDFVLSETGQNAVAEGGLTSYRDSVPPAEGKLTYQAIQEQVDEENIIRVPYEVVSEEEVAEFSNLWNSWMNN